MSEGEGDMLMVYRIEPNGYMGHYLAYLMICAHVSKFITTYNLVSLFWACCECFQKDPKCFKNSQSTCTQFQIVNIG